jgi:hypothetical protein
MGIQIKSFDAANAALVNCESMGGINILFFILIMKLQHEEFITTDDSEKHNMQQQILEERTKLLEQSNKDRDTALKEYLEAN